MIYYTKWIEMLMEVTEAWKMNRKKRAEKFAGRYAALAAGLLCLALCFLPSATQGAETASFSGKVFEDVNNNGVMDEDEPGVAGVSLLLKGKKTRQSYELVTDESGLFTFSGLAKDRYTFSAVLPDGMLYARYSKTGGDLRSVFTGENLVREFPVGEGEQVVSKNVGVIQMGAIEGRAFLDLNYNGYYDEGEPGYANVVVEAIRISNGDSYGKTQTDADGVFVLDNLRGADYRLRAILPEDGSFFTLTPGEATENANRLQQRGERRESGVEPISLQSGQTVSVLIGVAQGATVRGTAFVDADYNGRLDAKEKKLSGVQVLAVNEDGETVATAATGSDGDYTLRGLTPGSYTLRFKCAVGMGFTRLRPELDGGSYVAELLDGYGFTQPLEIAMGDALENVNAGMLPASTVTGFLFNDENDNGLWDEGETGMTSARVRLLSSDGEVDLIRSVEEDGTYLFEGVTPGQYTATYLLPEHVEMARTAENGNAASQTVTAAFQVEMGSEYVCPLAGAVELGSFSGVLLADGSGQGIAEATVTLTPDRSSAEEQIVATNREGAFLIEGLRPAEYRLTIELPEGWIFSGKSVDALTLAPTDRQTLSCDWAVLTGREKIEIGAVRPASVSGEIWLDENQNGKKEDGEARLSGVSVELRNSVTGDRAAVCVSTESGFRFDNVRPGEYKVGFRLPEQAEPAEEAAASFRLVGSGMERQGVTVKEGDDVVGLSAGLVSRTSLGGRLELQVKGEKSPAAGVKLSLRLAGEDAPLQTTLSDENGAYRFDGLWPGEYVIESELPDGTIFVRQNDPNYADGATIIETSDGVGGQSGIVVLEMARHQLELNVLLIQPARVGDQVWLDENGNGLIDGGEALLPGVRIRLLSEGETAYETVSDAWGYYLFDQVYPGTYTLQAEAYPELEPTEAAKGPKILSSCLNAGNGETAESEPFTVESGTSDMDKNLGYVLREGETLPAAVVEPPQRDWTESYQKYQQILEQQR